MANGEVCPTFLQLLAYSDDELAAVDPVVMNLLVAKGIPSQSGLDVRHYVRLADEWADDLRRRMPALQKEFVRSPGDWDHDAIKFRLGLVCWYVDIILGVAYREDQRDQTRIRYTDPTDLFLNGVMDTRRGTCGNLALLHVVLARRVGMPVSLACVGSHFILRYDDGVRTRNIETTQAGMGGGFSCQADEYILQKHCLPPKAQACGSDLKALSSREMLGVFVGLRARHFENTERRSFAESDYVLARHLFPNSRHLYFSQNQLSVQNSMELFEPGERGHPTELADWLQKVVQVAPWNRHTFPGQAKQTNHGRACHPVPDSIVAV